MVIGGCPDVGEAKESLAVAYKGREFSIAFNPGYLLDGLGAVDSETTRIDFTSPTKPAVLRGSKEADVSAGDDYRYLLMPVRLSG